MSDERFALVTGAGSGIGRALASKLARAGTRVVLVGRRIERLREVAAEVGDPTPIVLCGDLRRDADIERIARGAAERMPALHVLVHAAGVHAAGPVATTSAEAFDELFRVNVRAPFLLTQKLLPLLRSGGGDVVFLNSSAGRRARAGAGPYSATKHALQALADCLRQEEAPAGIRVLTVYPGRTATPMQKAILEEEGRTYRPERLVQPEDVADLVLGALALPRSAEVTELDVRPARPA